MNKYLLIKIMVVLISVFSQLLLKISANKIYNNKLLEYLNPYVIISYGLYAICTLLSVFSLKGISVLMSTVLESLNYVFIPVACYILFKETITKKQILGIAIILIGLFVFNI